MLRLLCIADPEAYRNASTDVPLGYARLASHPGVTLYHADTSAMRHPGTEIPCLAVPAGFDPASFGELSRQLTAKRPAQDFDLAFCRTLKPFPPGYLEELSGWSRLIPFLNDPAGIRRQLDPAFLLDVAGHFLPPARLARDPVELLEFSNAHGAIVAKRANSCGGRGVYRVFPDPGARFATDNIVEGPRSHADAMDLWCHLAGADAGPLLLMRYLPRVTRGEKRLVVVGGEIEGAYLRCSERGHWVQNVSQGARCDKVAVTSEDRALVAATCGPYLEIGVRLLGYDLIEDEPGTWRVSEINAGNVGGLFRLEAMGETGLTDRFVSFLADVARAARPFGAAPRFEALDRLQLRRGEARDSSLPRRCSS